MDWLQALILGILQGLTEYLPVSSSGHLAIGQYLFGVNGEEARLLNDNLAQTNALEQYLAPVPRPAYVVQNPNCCQNTCGCGTF